MNTDQDKDMLYQILDDLDCNDKAFVKQYITKQQETIIEDKYLIEKQQVLISSHLTMLQKMQKTIKAMKESIIEINKQKNIALDKRISVAGRVQSAIIKAERLLK